MARPKNPDTQPKPEVDVSDVPANRPEDATIASLIETAATELEEKAEVLARLQESRVLLSALVKKVGDREQVKWVRENLPRKQSKKAGVVEDETTE